MADFAILTISALVSAALLHQWLAATLREDQDDE